jgi:hypothetical protein
MISILALVFALLVPAESQPLDASRLSVSTPPPILSFTTAQLRGFPVRLAWSQDGRQLALRVVQRDRWANEREWFYLLTIGESSLVAAEREPGWLGGYWSWKSALGCPGDSSFRIEVETRVDRRAATNAGAGGAIGQNSGDPYGAGFDLGPQGQAILQGAMQSQQVTTTTLKLKGALLGEFVNTSAMTGLMYSWAPEGLAAMAFANSKRALVVMDRAGRRHDVSGTKGVLLPAWSPDGKRLAWLSQKGGGSFELILADVVVR